MRVPARDALPAAVLFATAQYEVWVGPLFGGLPGPRLANAVVLAFVFVPLLWRRSKPVLAFAVVLVAATMHVKIAHQGWMVAADEGLMQVWFALLIAFYSVAAHATPPAASAPASRVAPVWSSTICRSC